MLGSLSDQSIVINVLSTLCIYTMDNFWLEKKENYMICVQSNGG